MSASIPILETGRLVLRAWEPRHYEPFAAFWADEEASRFVGGPRNREAAWRALAMYAGHWSLVGHGYWAVEERDGGAFVGAVGVWKSEGWPEEELGYWIVPAMQRRGYAVEAATAARDHAFAELGLDTLVSYIDPANEASRRVAGKLGARYESTIDLAGLGPHECHRYPAPGA
jgi:RimJ/RimL family protein N-acetyltransferase